MKTVFTFIRSLCIIPVVLLMFACSRKSSIAIPPLDTTDNRLSLIGNYHFTTVKYVWHIGVPDFYDTLEFDGTIKLYEDGDQLIALNPIYPTNNAEKRVTIEFIDSTLIIPEISIADTFVTVHSIHYNHSGKFFNNTCSFEVSGLGGLSGGTNYIVNGYKSP